MRTSVVVNHPLAFAGFAVALASSVALAESSRPKTIPPATPAEVVVDTAAMVGNDQLPASEHPWPYADAARTVRGTPAAPEPLADLPEWPWAPAQVTVGGVPVVR